MPVDKETEGHTTLGWLNFTVFHVIGLAPFLEVHAFVAVQYVTVI